MAQVYRRRAEFIVAEVAPAGGTMTTRNGIIPVQMGDMLVHTGGDTQHYGAAEFAQQFEAVSYEDSPEHLREIADPERAREDREKAEKAQEREQAKDDKAAAAKTTKARVRKRPSRAGKTTKLQSPPNRDIAKEAEERRAQEEAGRTAQARQEQDERHSPEQAMLQDEGDFGPQPTPEAHADWSK